MNPDALLFRQINPEWVDAGVTTSQAFKPTSKDNGRLSVDDASLIMAEDAYKRYTECQGLVSVGVLAVTVAECNQQHLPTVPDPRTCQPSHAVIDFSNHSSNQIRKMAQRLKHFAIERGWQYQPSQPASKASLSSP